MQLVCPACAERFSLDDVVSPHGTRVACPKCQASVPGTWPSIGLDVEAPEPEPASVEEVVPALSLRDENIVLSPAPAAPLPAPAAPTVRAIPARSMPQAAVPGVRAAPAPDERWRFVIVVGATALLAVGVALLKGFWDTREIAPPEMPNPLAERAEEWRRSGFKPSAPSLAAALQAATDGLAAGTPQALKRARTAARSALLYAPSDAAAIAAYGAVLARWPDRLEEQAIDEALGAITSAVGDHPGGPHVSMLEQARAWLLMRTGRHEAARQAADRALALDPSAPAARLTRAVVRVPARSEDALDDLTKLSRAAPESQHIALWLGEAQWRSGAIGHALATWEGVARGRSEDAALAGRLGRAAVQLGDFDGAVARLDGLVVAGWASVDDRLILARLLARVKRRGGDAVRVLDGGLSTPGLFPLDRARLLCEKVTVLTSGGAGVASADELSRWLDEGLAAAPDLAELLYVAALVDEHLGARERAVESLEAAFELAPERPEVALRLALHVRVDDPDGAQQAVATGLREAPHYVPLHLLKAALALEAGDKAAAALAARRSFDLDPERYREGRLLEAWVDPPAAHQEVARLFQHHLRGADNPTLSTAAAMAYVFAGEEKRAEGLLGRALRADPNEVGARLARAILALKHGKRAAAQRDLRAAALNDSQHAIVRVYRARLYEASRQHELAESIYRDLLTVNPLDTAARLGLARALAGRGLSEPARDQARKIAGAPGGEGAFRLLRDLDRGKRPGRR